MNDKYTKRATEAAELERKAKQLRREEAAFIEEADSRKEELMDRWNVKLADDTATLKDLSDRYECSISNLLEFLFSDKAVEFFHDSNGIYESQEDY